VLSVINVASLIENGPKLTHRIERVAQSSFEALPILSYDTDVGFGYGAKAFFLNMFGGSESFDIVAFNSTKGERWYRLVFSIPDFELRQGKIYPWALDLVIDYDKWIKNSFFGIGSNSQFQEREYYTKEPLEVTLTIGRGFSTHWVGQLGARYKWVRNYGFESQSRLVNLPPELNRETARYTSILASVRYDTRNSFIHPWRGLVLLAELEHAPRLALGNVSFTRFAGSIQYYKTVFFPRTVLAARLRMEGLMGNDLPVQVLLPIGGGNTLCGYPQDRYLDKTAAAANVELRFPIYWRFGGVVGYDAGKVWNSLPKFDFHRWATNPIVGLRFYMDTFVVRADVGFGKETTGFYLNFGHMF
jgi:outer membrane protein assembly factor BamA